MKFIPGTLIENTTSNQRSCRPPMEKFRPVAMDTTAGDFCLLVGDDITDLEEAKAKAESMTGPSLFDGSGQTSNKVYVFDSDLNVHAEFGGI